MLTVISIRENYFELAFIDISTDLILTLVINNIAIVKHDR